MKIKIDGLATILSNSSLNCIIDIWMDNRKAISSFEYCSIFSIKPFGNAGINSGKYNPCQVPALEWLFEITFEIHR
jgi:hypothetical protein